MAAPLTRAMVTAALAACALGSQISGVVSRSGENRTMPQPAPTSVTRSGDTETTVRRRLQSPPAKVFAALTEPELLRQWMSANGRELTEARVDLKTGGSYRFVFRSPSGRTFGMYGTYKDVVPGRRIVHTEAYDGYDWEPLVTTTELQEDAGGTAMVMVIRYPNKKIRDEDFPNIESGTPDGLSRMEKLLAK
jgi:uncharacterized protein YndB with AHSA1/START domain